MCNIVNWIINWLSKSQSFCDCLLFWSDLWLVVCGGGCPPAEHEYKEVVWSVNSRQKTRDVQWWHENTAPDVMKGATVMLLMWMSLLMIMIILLIWKCLKGLLRSTNSNTNKRTLRWWIVTEKGRWIFCSLMFRRRFNGITNIPEFYGEIHKSLRNQQVNTSAMILANGDKGNG